MRVGEYAMAGFLTLRLNQHLTFELEVALDLGNGETKRTFVIDPEKVVPFMVNLACDGDHPLKFTSATLHGVAISGAQPRLVRAPGASQLGQQFGQFLQK